MIESRPLDTLLPSVPALHAILKRARAKYNVPPKLAENEHLAAPVPVRE